MSEMTAVLKVKKMNIVIHTQYYPPEIGAPQGRLSALARGLVKRGHSVTVLTAMPNYPRGVIYEGYGGWMKVEDVDGVRILRSWIYPTRSISFIPRLLNYFSFVFSSLIVGLLHLKVPDVILTESPPLFLGISGYLLSRLKRARWIFNVSDLWPESAVRLGMVREGLALQLSYWLEAFCYRNAWYVSGQSREILHNITSRFPSVRVYHLSNGADTAIFRPGSTSERWRNKIGNGTIALYAGLHGLAQGLDQVLRAAQLLSDVEGLKIVFIGDGPLKHQLIQQASQSNLHNVYFLESLPHTEMPAVLASADFCIVPLGMEMPGAVPSKLYEAMAAGCPVLLMAHGEAADIVRAHDCGLVVAPGDINALADGLRTLACNSELRTRLGTNGRRAAQEHYDRTAIVERFAKFLDGEKR